MTAEGYIRPNVVVRLNVYPDSRVYGSHRAVYHPVEMTATPGSSVRAPRGYRGLYAFHKYWGKKPHEPIAQIIQWLTRSGDVVLDPFVGSGPVAREAVRVSRRFVGCDLNPLAVELTRLLLRPPDVGDLARAFDTIKARTKPAINKHYLLNDGATIATHYLWNHETLEKVWVSRPGGRRELDPTAHDCKLSAAFAGYRSRVSCPKFFSNSRINARSSLSLDDLFTGRARRSIDLLIEAIDDAPQSIRTPLRLCLTSASGQMSKMVFAVTSRGKTTGRQARKIEVGSWVIGYWRPRLHFEINVWNCFERRAKKLLAALSDEQYFPKLTLGRSADRVLAHKTDAFVACGDCRELLDALPAGSIDLMLTDPPHSDRVPYLELSTLWNSLMGYRVDFKKEIVISNARERGKSPQQYACDMSTFLERVPRVLSSQGHFVLLFNARQSGVWEVLRSFAGSNGKSRLSCAGHFPCHYSATSVVQDHRPGSLKNDYALVFTRGASLPLPLRSIPGWGAGLPGK